VDGTLFDCRSVHPHGRIGEPIRRSASEGKVRSLYWKPELRFFGLFSPLSSASAVQRVRADWQPVLLWPLPTDSSLPLSLPLLFPIPESCAHSPYLTLSSLTQCRNSAGSCNIFLHICAFEDEQLDNWMKTATWLAAMNYCIKSAYRNLTSTAHILRRCAAISDRNWFW